MYNIRINGKEIAKTELEAGDPPMGCVSGIVLTQLDALEFSEILVSAGGLKEDFGVRLELDNKVSVFTEGDIEIPYFGGALLCYPEINETLIELVGIPYPEYGNFFPNHVEEYKRKFKLT